MKNGIFIFIIFFSPFISSAQTVSDVYKAKIDSVQNLLNTYPSNDTIRVKRLNELARLCYINIQYKRGFVAAGQARTLAQKLNYKKGEALYYRTMSFLEVDDYLYAYFNLKANWLYRSIHENEEKLDFIYYEYSPEVVDKLTKQLLNDIPLLKKEQNRLAIACWHDCLFSLNFRYRQKPGVALPYLDSAIKEFNVINEVDLALASQLQKMETLEKTDKRLEAQQLEKNAILTISKLNDKNEAIFLDFLLDQYYNVMGKSALEIEFGLKLNDRLEEDDMAELKARVLGNLAVNFGFVSMPVKAVEYYKKAISLLEQTHSNDYWLRSDFINLGFELVGLKDFDEADKYFLKGKESAIRTKDSNTIYNAMYKYSDGTGQILMGKGKYQEALKLFLETNNSYKADGTNNYLDFYIAQCQQKLGYLKESIKYGEKSYNPSLSMGDQRLILKICNLLYEVYDQIGQQAKAYKYLKKYRNILKEREEQDIANRSSNFEIQSIIEKNQLEKDRLEKDKIQKEKENQNQRWWLISIAGALISAFVLLYVLLRNNNQKQKANALLQQQKEEINIQKDKAEKTLTELKSTQAQLIQSEKMASLGELTAGIAHEIQNPLNFVNNFSEVNKEMLVEATEEIDKGNLTEVKNILNDIKDNEEKINHHGKRADAIVKGMLQHSRQTKGIKELTDINALCDEYLRLNYHGLRAKDKNFNADFKTDFDESIGMINIVPQDIGRVLLNLFNNAFYAVNEKLKAQTLKLSDNYKPLVSVQTKKINNKVEITVSDNGNGVPQNIIDKIFQPFFTTKPTGQGTGLGLSLAYDIITKEHNGTITVESTENEGSLFIILLPC